MAVTFHSYSRALTKQKNNQISDLNQTKQRVKICCQIMEEISILHDLVTAFSHGQIKYPFSPKLVVKEVAQKHFQGSKSLNNVTKG